MKKIHNLPLRLSGVVVLLLLSEYSASPNASAAPADDAASNTQSTAIESTPPAPVDEVPSELEAAEPAEKEINIVVERSNNLVGVASSASEGTVGPRQLERRPILRPGELLETVPGVIVTQHSGAGKANQFFLRGFNLDHGTDLATWLDGVPVNMPTHGHGQGYTDLNFLIPELISGIRYQKGSYRAAQGDFSAAGTVHISYARRLQKGIAGTTLGENGYRRLVAADSPTMGRGNLTYGFELYRNDGPWVRPDDYRRFNGVLRYNRGDERNGFTLTGMGYDGKWNATDQVPQRAIDSGLISRFGFIDPTDGGKSHRYSLSGQVRRGNDKSQTRANFYTVYYKMNLFSNFTYFLDGPVRGDQFEQADNRRVFGFNAEHEIKSRMGKRPMENVIGLQTRHDRIKPVGLYLTERRERFDTVREDRVKETSVAPYFENRIQWSPRFRTTAGLRYDRYSFDVKSSIAANSGKLRDSILSPKLSLAFGPFNKTDYYFNLARGFHSNDARGTTITIDPKTGLPASRVTPLVRANMAEIGVRTTAFRNLQSTLALWYLKLDSELLFVGDAGTTEASRPSRRIGIEFTNYYTPKPWLTLDADFAIAQARFTDRDPAGRRIPGAIEGVIATGIAVDHPKGYFGSLRVRYFGPRPLIEDNSVRSSSSTLVNARLGYRFRNDTRLALEVFNLFNSNVSDIDYFYTSRLPGEPAGGVDDIHTHSAESRSLRLTLSRTF